MSKWSRIKLAEIADIRVSNVDKKSYQGEKSVMLCNYMDVYSNDYITHDISFMEATANTIEIKKFTISKGDVLITKDSESPFDIGIPAVVEEDIDNLICGYHLAQLKPDHNKVDSVFLAKQLAMPDVCSYFSRVAAGSTRYGLSNRAIANTSIVLPSLEIQRKISSILQILDKSIEKTELLIDKYNKIKNGMMHDLFSRGIGSDGKLRESLSSNPSLYKETPYGFIPVEWDICLLDDIAIRGSGHTPNKKIPAYWNGGIKWVSLADSSKLDNIYISNTELELSTLGIQNSSAVVHPKGTVILSRDAGVGKSAILAEEMAVSQHFMAWRCGNRLNNLFLYYWLQFNKRNFENIAMGSTIVTIGLPYFKKMKIQFPKKTEEQESIASKLKAIDDYINKLKQSVSKNKNKKRALMHELLTGKKCINFESENVEVNHV
ncbi:restriction endonuclease subunit S [Citrobacter youngae]